MLYWMFMTVVYQLQGYMVHSLCDSGVGGLAPMAELAPPSPTMVISIMYHGNVHMYHGIHHGNHHVTLRNEQLLSFNYVWILRATSDRV